MADTPATPRKRKRTMTAAQKKWCMEYQRATGFYPLMDDYLSGRKSFVVAAKDSCVWFEDWSVDALHAVDNNIPGAAR